MNNSSDPTKQQGLILLVEDDPVLARSVQLNLELDAWQVRRASNLSEARRIEAESKISGIILDLGLPDGSGLTFLRELRARSSKTPILILTAQTNEDTVVAGLEAGANDYIRKPFSMRELMARVKNTVKETNIKNDEVRFGSLVVSRSLRTASVGGIQIDLNRREFDILTFLADHGGQVISRDRLLTEMNVDGEVFDRTIDSHISHIRARLKKAGITQIAISSVYGVGYRLEEKPEDKTP
ncbi:MAG: response regulator transcription factor [Bdellovibrionales bacterium]|nr:response regulator transcription factor [Bdellovibrionales bacterium]